MKRKGSGALRSTLITAVGGILVAVSYLAQEIRARDAAPPAADSHVSAPAYATEVDPTGFIPGFDPEADMDVIQKILADETAKRPPPASAPQAAQAHAAAPKPLPVQPNTPAPQKKSVDRFVEVRSDITLADLDAIKRELMSYADEASEEPAPAETGEPHDSTTSAFLVQGEYGPQILLLTKDEFGMTRRVLDLSPALGKRLSAKISKKDRVDTLLFVEHTVVY